MISDCTWMCSSLGTMLQRRGNNWNKIRTIGAYQKGIFLLNLPSKDKFLCLFSLFLSDFLRHSSNGEELKSIWLKSMFGIQFNESFFEFGPKPRSLHQFITHAFIINLFETNIVIFYISRLIHSLGISLKKKSKSTK